MSTPKPFSDMTVAELEAGITSLQKVAEEQAKTLSTTREGLRDYVLHWLKCHYKIDNGSIVTYAGKVFKISKIRAETDSTVHWLRQRKPWVSGFLRKKDGTYGREQALYSDWQVLDGEHLAAIEAADKATS